MPAVAPKPMSKWAVYALAITTMGTAVPALVAAVGGRSDTAQTYEILRGAVQDVAAELRAQEARTDARLDAIEQWLARSDGYREARRFAASGQPAPLPLGVAGPPAPPEPVPAGDADALARRIEALPESL